MSTKELVLGLLEQRRGCFVSGEELAQSLELSRNAVWKAVNALRSDGYAITAVTNQGYCLSGGNDLLSVQGILPLLKPECRQYAPLFQMLDAPESTNHTAKELALAGAPHGTVLLADSQRSGRGRNAHSFFSPAGGLYMSLILHADRLPFTDMRMLTELAAVSACDAIRDVAGKTAEIKPVNDILIGGKKVCGILTEGITDFESGGLSWIVLGIGMNVHAKPDDFPPELRGLAASVGWDIPADGLRNRLAAAVISRILSDDIPQKRTLHRHYSQRLAPQYQ